MHVFRLDEIHRLEEKQTGHCLSYGIRVTHFINNFIARGEKAQLGYSAFVVLQRQPQRSTVCRFCCRYKLYLTLNMGQEMG